MRYVQKDATDIMNLELEVTWWPPKGGVLGGHQLALSQFYPTSH